MAKKEERFEVIFRDGSSLKDDGVRQILVDKETGVNYLCWKSGLVFPSVEFSSVSSVLSVLSSIGPPF